MRAVCIVFAKEFVENLRDRRTLISALLFGPLFGPLLFGAMVSRTVNQSITQSDQALQITISGSTAAPGLTQYLASHGATLTRVEFSEEGARDAVKRGLAPLVLIVPPEYPARFLAAKPAALLLAADSADSQTRKSVDRLKALIASFSGSIAQLRLQVRGIDPALAVPVVVNDVDVATPAARAVVILGFMTYFVLFAMLMGGLYLAIDCTAGERERGSLESLLILPVTRAALVLGKILATCAYMALSLAICLTAFVVVFRFVPLDELGMSSNLSFGAAIWLFGICIPFIPLGAALMTFVASFTRSYREAQTYLTTVLLVPTVPIAFASIYSLKAKSSLMAIPSLSQHLLMTSVLRGESLAPMDVAVSAIVSLGLAVILAALTARHWRRETMLG
jgi:sodium transport system permease protein